MDPSVETGKNTLEARALTPTTTQLYYTLVYDNSNLADDAAREADIARRRQGLHRHAPEHEDSLRRRHANRWAKVKASALGTSFQPYRRDGHR
jgi:hypothetical protein